MSKKYILGISNGVAEELIRQNISIPSSTNGWFKQGPIQLDSFGDLRYMSSHSTAMQVFLETKKWTMSYLPIQLFQVYLQCLCILLNNYLIQACESSTFLSSPKLHLRN